MKDPKQQVSPSRRSFLRDAGIGTGAALAAASAPGAALADAAGTEQAEKPQRGYRLTRHILDYYKSAAS
jgi:hypothetical protein